MRVYLLFFSWLSAFVTVAYAESVICPTREGAYRIDIMKNQHWSAAMINNMDLYGNGTNSMEAFFKESDGSFELQVIEGNQLRKITMEKPSGDLKKTTKITWAPSIYGFGRTQTDICYDSNGITPEIKQKIVKTQGYESLMYHIQTELSLSKKPEVELSLLTVNSMRETIVFLMEMRWMHEDQDCVALIEIANDFGTITAMKTDDNSLFQCDRP